MCKVQIIYVWCKNWKAGKFLNYADDISFDLALTGWTDRTIGFQESVTGTLAVIFSYRGWVPLLELRFNTGSKCATKEGVYRHWYIHQQNNEHKELFS